MVDATYIGNHDFTGATLLAALGDTAYQGSERTTTSLTYVDTTLATVTLSGTDIVIAGIQAQCQIKSNNVSYTSSVQLFITGTILGDWSMNDDSDPIMVNNATETWVSTTSTSFIARQDVYVPVNKITLDATTTISLRIKTDNGSGLCTIQATRIRVYGWA